MACTLVVGGQWGDEGKGKIVDLLAAEVAHVVRAQGGANAGHTIVIDQREYKFHLIPSGILQPHAQCYLGAGVVIDGQKLLEEIDQLNDIEMRGRLWISARAHLVLPYHKTLDTLIECRKGLKAVGTTGRGIGPCYADRTSRIGIRVGELLDLDCLNLRLRDIVEAKNVELTTVYGADAIAFETLRELVKNLAEQLGPYITDVEARLIVAKKSGEGILLEGAQGTLLDTSYGTYPYVTSSPTCSAGILLGAGLAPKYLDRTIAVMKAYCTRVGNGPFPTEDAHMITADHASVREVGTTTGRNRRMGWFDAVLARWSVDINGADGIALTKLDILDTLSEIKVCVAYQLDGKIIDTIPASTNDLVRVKPIYERLPGWQVSTRQAKEFNQLPKQAQDYIQFLSKAMGAPISIVSVGPDRSETFVVDHPAHKEMA